MQTLSKKNITNELSDCLCLILLPAEFDLNCFIHISFTSSCYYVEKIKILVCCVYAKHKMKIIWKIKYITVYCICALLSVSHNILYFFFFFFIIKIKTQLSNSNGNSNNNNEFVTGIAFWFYIYLLYIFLPLVIIIIFSNIILVHICRILAHIHNKAHFHSHVCMFRFLCMRETVSWTFTLMNFFLPLVLFQPSLLLYNIQQICYTVTELIKIARWPLC